MSMMDWAKAELDAAGLKESGNIDDVSAWVRQDVLALLQVFVDQGHSGMSAPYVLKLFDRLANWKPLSPLTGETDEWTEVGPDVWQNKRASNVFKGEDSRAYWMDGRVFWEWSTHPEVDEGKPFKSYFTSRDSRVYIDEFPWKMPDEPEYVEVESVK